MTHAATINFEAYRLRNFSEIPERKTRVDKEAPADQKRLKLFLRGPIDMYWIEAAARLPGKALQVGIALWHLVGITKSQTVKMQKKILTRMGISRQAYNRCLGLLEKSVLVKVQRNKGQTPLVTVLDLVGE